MGYLNQKIAGINTAYKNKNNSKSCIRNIENNYAYLE